MRIGNNIIYILIFYKTKIYLQVMTYREVCADTTRTKQITTEDEHIDIYIEEISNGQNAKLGVTAM